MALQKIIGKAQKGSISLLISTQGKVHRSFQAWQELAQQPRPVSRKKRVGYTRNSGETWETRFSDPGRKTGFAWEQYNPDTGKGQRTRDFTGGTSLIVRVLAMPDLPSRSQPLPGGYTNQPTDTDGRRITLTLTVTGMMLICFLFRRRLMRAWRGFLEP